MQSFTRDVTDSIKADELVRFELTGRGNIRVAVRACTLCTPYQTSLALFWTPNNYAS